MLIQAASPHHPLPEAEIARLLRAAFAERDLAGQRVLVIIPDSTRTAPIPLFFRLFHENLSGKAAALDYLVALGTHPMMNEAALNRLVGITAEERRTRYSDVNLFNHRWDLPETFVTVGELTEADTATLSDGQIALRVPVRVNKLLFDYDQLIICGPVFPHEVAGYSGGSKYFFPGVGGAEVIDFTHWLGALVTSYHTIGIRDTAVRRAIEMAAAFIDCPTLAVCMVTQGERLAGLYVGNTQTAWAAAAEHSAQIHVRYVPRPFRQVLSVIPEMYDDLWTGAKGMYKLEPVIADDGEVILYAPHITEVSYTHGHILGEIGYHVRDYFVRQWERFRHYPWGVLAHSTHLRGMGAYEDGVERARIRVTLATGIPPERCARLGLGYRDPAGIDPEDWRGREDEGVLLVPKAGERLFRLRQARAVILMGVSGCGKSTVGQALAAALGWAFHDGDDYHPPENVAKMSAGQPLTDADRVSWLAALHNLIAECLSKNQEVVVACSALKQAYRNQLLTGNAGAEIVYLRGSFELIEARMKARAKHYMRAGMLASQFAALEEPEGVLAVDIGPPVEQIAEIIQAHVSRQPQSRSVL